MADKPANAVRPQNGRPQSPALATSPSGRELQQRAVQTREAVLLAAADVFYQEGYSAATIGEIAARAEVTKGALYFHYPSKAALAVAVLEEHHAAWAQVMAESREWQQLALDKIDALIKRVARSYVQSAIARAGVRLGNEYQAIDADLPVPFVGWIEAMTNLLRTGQQDGSVARTLDAPAAARVIVASFFGVQEVSERLNARADLEQRVAEWWSMLAPALSRGIG
ncbi:ScbR family autoregulator-binding transcription factor [uncultured Jatrophihabitans sp.]|uniref:ScbR family autoregulator-binding transcription factor n=1 Tax=uncultured Jatrophihabitans sp. TaxID=1610747 RepID=UPI0035CC5DD1